MKFVKSISLVLLFAIFGANEVFAQVNRPYDSDSIERYPFTNDSLDPSEKYPFIDSWPDHIERYPFTNDSLDPSEKYPFTDSWPDHIERYPFTNDSLDPSEKYPFTDSWPDHIERYPFTNDSLDPSEKYPFTDSWPDHIERYPFVKNPWPRYINIPIENREIFLEVERTTEQPVPENQYAWSNTYQLSNPLHIEGIEGDDTNIIYVVVVGNFGGEDQFFDQYPYETDFPEGIQYLLCNHRFTFIDSHQANIACRSDYEDYENFFPISSFFIKRSREIRSFCHSFKKKDLRFQKTFQ